MLKFIDENDFSLAEKWEQNDDGTYSWWYQNSNGIIRNGLIRTHEVQVGTEQTQVGVTKTVYDGEGKVINPSEPIYEEQSVYETQEIDVYEVLKIKIGNQEVSLYQPTQEEIEAKALAEFVQSRQTQLNSATVTTQAGNEYDADEKSINRMSFAILAASNELDSFELEWSLASTGTGVMTTVTLGDIKEAQQLAVIKMSAIWAVPIAQG